MRAVLLAALLAGGVAVAHAQMTGMPGMTHAGQPGQTPAVREYRTAMDRMMRDMDITYTGDADRDFVAGMLPHHQGAVDMAKVELRYGKDPELRKLAEDIVAAQEKEIAFMRAWQAKHR